MRLELILPAVRHQLLRPGLKRNLHRPRRPGLPRSSPGTGQPYAGFARNRTEIHSAIRIMRSRTGGRSRTSCRTARSGKLIAEVGIPRECKNGLGQYEYCYESRYPVTHQFLLPQRIIVDFVFFPLLEKEGWMRRVRRGADGVVSSAES